MRKYLFITLLAFAACKSNDKEYKVPARKALIIADAPVYDGLAATVAGVSTTTLPPFTEIFVTSDSATGNGVAYVRVLWGDSSGYVKAENFARHARAGVVDALPGPLELFADKKLTAGTSAKINGYALVAVLEEDGDVALVMKDPAAPATGYINKNNLTTDSVAVAFCKLYTKLLPDKNGSGKEAWAALSNDKRFVILTAHSVIFSGNSDDNDDSPIVPADPNEEKYPDADESKVTKLKHKAFVWTDEQGNPLSYADRPGKITVHYIYENKTESTINHVGDTLENGYPSCEPIDKSIISYRVYFTPKWNMDFKISVNVALSPDFNERSGPFEQSFTTAEAGKRYSFIARFDNSSYVTCGDATITVSTNGAKGTGKYLAGCGD